MKSLKKIVTLSAVVFVIGVVTITGFAASNYKTPAEAVAGLTGKTVDAVIAERQESNSTFGAMAAEAGKLEEFKVEALEMRKDNLNAQVEAGTMTQERADAIMNQIQERQMTCDGTGSERIGQQEGAKFGSYGAGEGLRDGEQDHTRAKGGKRAGNGS